MIKKITDGNQTAYFQNSFKKKLLPDLKAAGPISASLIGEMANPLKFMTSGPRAETSDMAWGSLVDMLWLTPQDFDQHVLVIPRDAPKKPTKPQLEAPKPTAKATESINWWSNFQRRSLGKTVVDEPTLALAKEAVKMLNTNTLCAYIYDCCEKQVILSGTTTECHPSSVELNVKAMMDLLPMRGTIEVDGLDLDLNTCVVDLKQCHMVSDFGMKKAINTYQYHIKMAWYLRMMRAYGETKRVNAILIFQNSLPPHDAHVRMIEPEDIERADNIITQRIDLMGKIDSTDLSNLYDTEVRTISTSFR